MNAHEARPAPASPARVATSLAVAALAALVEGWLTLTHASDGRHVATLAAVLVAGRLGRVGTRGWRRNDLVGRPWVQWSLAGLVFFVAIDSSDVWFDISTAHSASHLPTLLAFAATWALVVGWLSERIRRGGAAREDGHLPTSP